MRNKFRIGIFFGVISALFIFFLMSAGIFKVHATCYWAEDSGYSSCASGGLFSTKRVNRCSLNNTGAFYACCDDGETCPDAAESPYKSNLPSTKAILKDVQCGDSNSGIQTAIGCIDVLSSTDTFMGQILKWAVGIGGGIAFLLILYAGFMIMSSQGNPERLKAGQELLTSAISGLILLILSVFILKFIGVDILGLKKFGFGT